MDHVWVTYSEQICRCILQGVCRSGRDAGLKSSATPQDMVRPPPRATTERYMTIPLVQTGPGGQYITSYLPHGRRIVAYTGLAGQLAAANNQPDGESAGGFTPGFTAQNHRHAHEQAADESSDCTRRTKP